MQADWFIASVSSTDTELKEEHKDALLKHALAFLAAGGHLSWSEWAMLSEESRTAFQTAGELVEQARCRVLVAEMAGFIVQLTEGAKSGH